MAGNGNAKLAEIEKRIKQLSDRKAELLRADKKQASKTDTREKVLIGAGVLADIKAGNVNRDGIQDILKRAIVAPKDRDFLKGRGWNL